MKIMYLLVKPKIIYRLRYRWFQSSAHRVPEDSWVPQKLIKELGEFNGNRLVFVVYLYSSTNRGNNGNVSRLIATHRAHDGCHSQVLSWQHTNWSICHPAFSAGNVKLLLYIISDICLLFLSVCTAHFKIIIIKLSWEISDGSYKAEKNPNPEHFHFPVWLLGHALFQSVCLSSSLFSLSHPAVMNSQPVSKVRTKRGIDIFVLLACCHSENEKDSSERLKLMRSMHQHSSAFHSTPQSWRTLFT